MLLRMFTRVTTVRSQWRSILTLHCGWECFFRSWGPCCFIFILLTCYRCEGFQFGSYSVTQGKEKILDRTNTGLFYSWRVRISVLLGIAVPRMGGPRTIFRLCHSEFPRASFGAVAKVGYRYERAHNNNSFEASLRYNVIWKLRWYMYCWEFPPVYTYIPQRYLY